MSTPEDLGWGAPGLERTVRVDCPGIPLRVRPEVAALFAELVRWLTVERARHGAPPLESSGGYNKRLIRGSLTKWSNHSWGLAADFNAAANPMGRRLVTDMPPGTSAKAKSLGMRWGGDYTGRKDAMHFEVIVGPAEVRRLVAGLSRPAPVQEDDEMTPSDREWLTKLVDDRVRILLRAEDANNKPTGHDSLKAIRADLHSLGADIAALTALIKGKP